MTVIVDSQNDVAAARADALDLSAELRSSVAEVGAGAALVSVAARHPGLVSPEQPAELFTEAAQQLREHAAELERLAAALSR